ncbi:MAG: hypothetical protein PHN18_07200 [Sulfurospirillaceae bacterium]|jgi:hypothetical protein|nr:hypothetical protein [Sulfurospirillaceae bacterium]MDD2827183.1 hypothetical protein [Sulfurospirillaceae bacterium]
MANKRAFNEKARQIAQNPKVQEAFKSMKPEKSIWGILGVIVFFILPEIIAYFWGAEITQYAKAALPLAASFVEAKSYELLIMLFEDGMSWFNLLFGLALLVWLFF